MRFKQFSEKHKHLNLERKELERKWRLKKEEEELFEAVSRKFASQQNFTSIPGGSFPTTSISSQLMMIHEKDATTYTYYVFNYDNSSLEGPHDSGISVEDYPLIDSTQYIVNNSGYCHKFYNSDNNDFVLLFIGTTGSIIEKISGNSTDLYVNELDGRYIIAYDYDLSTLWIFDGKKVIVDDITFANVDSYTTLSSWNSTSLEGFLIESSKVVGLDTEKKFYIGNINNIKEIYNATISDGTDIQYNIYTSSFSNKYLITKYNNDSGFYIGFTIIDSKGNILQDETLLSDTYTDIELNPFGTNKFYMIFYNGSDTDVDYEIYVYDGLKNNLLHRSLNYGNTYTNRDNFREVRNTYNFSDYNFSENIMFAFYHPTGNTAYDLTEVDYCKFIGFFEGESEFIEYDFANNEIKYINFSDINTSEVFLFPTDESGNFSFLILSKNGSDGFVTNVSSGDQNTGTINDTRIGNKTLLYFLNGDTEYWYVYMVNSDATQFILLDEELTSFNLDVEFDTAIIHDVNSSLAWYFISTSSNWLSTTYYYNYNHPTLYSEDTNLSKGNIVGYSTNRLFHFNDMGDGKSITDGGHDMFNIGNILNTNLGIEIPYTHTPLNLVDSGTEAKLSDFIMDGQVVAGNGTNFGVTSNYFTNLYPGLFVMIADTETVSEFYTSGNNGAGGSGVLKSYTYNPLGHAGSYKAYIKTISYASEDPSINQVFIINTDGTGVTHDPGNTTDSSYNSISGIDDATRLHYLLFSKADGTEVTETEMQNVINSYLDIVDEQIITLMLTDLNTYYETITANLPAHSNLAEGTIYTRTKTFDVSLNDYEDLDSGKDVFALWYYDTNREDKITLKVYNYSGSLLQTLETDDEIIDDFFVVNNRVFLSTYTTYFDDGIYRVYNFHHVSSSYKTTITKTVSDELSIKRAINDWPWWND